MRAIACLALTVLGIAAECPGEPVVLKHVVVFDEPDRFAGWPAGHGMWSWGQELLVGFSVGTHEGSGSGHAIDRQSPEHHVLARSRNGGETWSLDYPANRGMLINQGGMRKGTMPPGIMEDLPAPIVMPIRFDHADFCMTLRLESIHGGQSRLYYSYDRGIHWRGPFRVPMFGQPGIMARTDYVVNGLADCHILLTAAKSNGREGRVLCARTQDGGLTWKRLSFVGPEPAGFSIMPSTVRLANGNLLTATRRRSAAGQPKARWIDVWNTTDNGRVWSNLGTAVADLGEGNPPCLVRLSDGRVCLTYGVRKPPYEIHARFSRDMGQSWGPSFVLKTGGGGPDIGYTRTVQLPDSNLVTVYYFHERAAGNRKILATIWRPS